LSISEAVKKFEKLALHITPEDKSNKQQNQATHCFSLITKAFPISQSTHLNAFQLWPAVR